MRDIEPRLLLLREIEARIAFAEFHVGDQRAAVDRLDRLGLHASASHDLLRSMHDALVILRLRRDDLLQGMEVTTFPSARPTRTH